MLGKGRVKHIIVVIDYFTKWVEAEPFATITAKVITKFLWKNIVCRFGIPYSIISNNEKQFDSKHYKKWYRELGIQAKYSSLGHP